MKQLLPRITLVALLSTAGCITNQSARGELINGRGVLLGNITLPDDIGPGDEKLCDGLGIRVSRRDKPLVFDLMKVWRDGRCVYQASGLPDNGKLLTLEVEPGPNWRCNDGTAPVLQESAWKKLITLRRSQSLIQDFHFACPASTAEAQASTLTDSRRGSSTPTLRRPRRAATEPLDARLERLRVLVPAVAGLGLGVAGGVMYGQAMKTHRRLESEAFAHRTQAYEVLDTGRRQQTWAFVLGGGALAMLGSSILLYFTPLESPAPRVSLVPSAGGAFVSISGGLP